jgi:hypothetical protein
VSAFALAAPGSASAGRTPASLAKALLTSSITTSLPKGLPKPTRKVFQLSDHSKLHHAVGGVALVFANAENAEVVYWVFPTRRDALADYQGSKTVSGVTHATAPSSLPKPSQITNGSIVMSGHKAGISAVEFVSDNVIVLSVATSTKSTAHGDIPLATSLAQFALRHLTAVRKRGSA